MAVNVTLAFWSGAITALTDGAAITFTILTASFGYASAPLTLLAGSTIAVIQALGRRAVVFNADGAVVTQAGTVCILGALRSYSFTFIGFGVATISGRTITVALTKSLLVFTLAIQDVAALAQRTILIAFTSATGDTIAAFQVTFFSGLAVIVAPATEVGNTFAIFNIADLPLATFTITTAAGHTLPLNIAEGSGGTIAVVLAQGANTLVIGAYLASLAIGIYFALHRQATVVFTDAHPLTFAVTATTQSA